MRNSELGDFLRTRRAAVSPSDAGLPESDQRRVPGLRREEVAQLVGVSTDYYVRLEQGRGGHPSSSVVDAIARALQLTSAEHAHLADIARVPDPTALRPRRPATPTPSAGVLGLLAQLDMPAMILTRCVQVVAWNALAARLLGPFDELAEHERNIARLLFTDTDLAARHRDWDQAARDIVGILRMTAGREPDNLRLQELVGELAVRNPTFRRLWGSHHVHEKTSGPKPMRHPEVGDIDLRYETLVVASDPRLMLVTYTAQPGSRSAEALNLLRTLVASEDGTAPRADAIDRRRSAGGHPLRSATERSLAIPRARC